MLPCTNEHDFGNMPRIWIVGTFSFVLDIVSLFYKVVVSGGEYHFLYIFANTGCFKISCFWCLVEICYLFVFICISLITSGVKHSLHIYWPFEFPLYWLFKKKSLVFKKKKKDWNFFSYLWDVNPLLFEIWKYLVPFFVSFSCILMYDIFFLYTSFQFCQIGVFYFVLFSCLVLGFCLRI